MIVDKDVHKDLGDYTWSDNGNGYLFRRECLGRKRYKKIYLHREILGACAGEYVDHINGNRADNRRTNLRICSNAQNAANQRGRKGSTSRFKGVYFDKKSKGWVAQITHLYKNEKLGKYMNETEAALAYNHAAFYKFGSFALLNDIVEVAK